MELTPETTDLVQKSIYWRGEIMNDTVVLERTMEACIAVYITADLDIRSELFELVLDRMTFESTRTSFANVLIKMFGEEMYKTKYKSLIEDVRKVIIQRNYFAHYMINTTPEAIEKFPKEIGFIEFRDSTKTHWYSEQKYKDYVLKITLCVNQVETIYKTLKKIIDTPLNPETPQSPLKTGR